MGSSTGWDLVVDGPTAVVEVKWSPRPASGHHCADYPDRDCFKGRAELNPRLSSEKLLPCRTLTHVPVSTHATLHATLQIVFWSDVHLHCSRIHGKGCGSVRPGGPSFGGDLRQALLAALEAFDS